MVFPRKLLNSTEEIVLDLHPHWWSLTGGVGALLGSVAIGGVALSFDWWDWLKWVTAVLVVIALVFFLIRLAEWRTTNFVVTTDRCIFRSGVLAKSGVEIPLERINTIFFNQSIFERIIGGGDLAIESAGERGTEKFSDIRRPSMVQNTIYRQIEENENRKYQQIGHIARQQASDATSVAQSAQLSGPEQIEKLAELRDRGVISEAEFQAKKDDLLRRM